MKMNKTMLLGEVANRSGIPADECGVVLKTFERVLCEELHTETVPLWRMDIAVDRFVCISLCFRGETSESERASGPDHSVGWLLTEIPNILYRMRQLDCQIKRGWGRQPTVWDVSPFRRFRREAYGRGSVHGI